MLFLTQFGVELVKRVNDDERLRGGAIDVVVERDRNDILYVSFCSLLLSKNSFDF